MTANPPESALQNRIAEAARDGVRAAKKALGVTPDSAPEDAAKLARRIIDDAPGNPTEPWFSANDILTLAQAVLYKQERRDTAEAQCAAQIRLAENLRTATEKAEAQVTALRTALEDIGNGPSLWGYEHSATARAALSANPPTTPDTTTKSGESDG